MNNYYIVKFQKQNWILSILSEIGEILYSELLLLFFIVSAPHKLSIN